MPFSEDTLETVPDPLPVVEELETQLKTVGAGPRLFGRYRPIRELGRGGGGVVWLARDEVLEIPVALKVVPDSVVHDTEGIIDLKKEVLRGMALTHPGIVRVFSFEQENTAAAIVMEYVEGETLADNKLRQEGRCFDCDEVRPWLEQLCVALDYAHTEACIAHRDLKPRNIMLAPNNRVKVADFGIASSLADSLSRVSVRVDSSGTPPYMSPQQVLGERPTRLDDIYSLGATIYELLTSKPPFFRGNILAQVLHEDAPSMAERRAELGITGKAPIPETWERLVAACLAKEPAKRPCDGAAVLAFLNPPPSVPEPVFTPAPLLAIRESQLPAPAQPAMIDVTVSPVPVRHAYPAAWTYEPEADSSGPTVWPRTLLNVVVAAALIAAVLHGVKKWSGSRSEANAPAVQQTAVVQTVAVPALVAKERAETSAERPEASAATPRSVTVPKPVAVPRTGLTTGNLDQPPEGPVPRRGPRRGPPPHHPPGRP